MKYSRFAEHYAQQSGMFRLMDDLGGALASDEHILMLGGGNPSLIPEVEVHFRQRMEAILADGRSFERLIGHYESPQGSRLFAEALARLLNEAHGWTLGPENIVLTTGSQAAFFTLLNAFGGEYPDGSQKRILLPMVPEYIGYAEVGVAPGLFSAYRPQLERTHEHRFKYHIDFDRLTVGSDSGAICVSRPTNPTGNVLTDDEMQRLLGLAKTHDIPFLIDAAYGLPFPGILFTEASTFWEEHVVLFMSLSKLGLPGARTGIVIANEEVVRLVSTFNAIMNLAPNGIGAALTIEMIRSGQILQLSNRVIAPFYRHKCEQAASLLDDVLQGLNYAIHEPEGALFLWLWLPDLPISNEELYQRLKARRVLVLAGHYFFPGTEDWDHRWQCIRISYAQDDDIVAEGIKIIGEEVRAIMAETGKHDQS
jgi:valine--pyruvate aminotransferase